MQVVLEVMKGSRPWLPAEGSLPPGTSSSTCEHQQLKPCAGTVEFCHESGSLKPTVTDLARDWQIVGRCLLLQMCDLTFFRGISGILSISLCAVVLSQASGATSG